MAARLQDIKLATIRPRVASHNTANALGRPYTQDTKVSADYKQYDAQHDSRKQVKRNTPTARNSTLQQEAVDQLRNDY